MRKKNSTSGDNTKRAKGFTLVELLVVMAIISLLMAILLPTLAKVRTLSRRVLCRSNIRQIYTGWQVYFEDNDQKFYRGLNDGGINANIEFGGWRGSSGEYGSYRPISECLNMDPNSEESTEIFRCPADSGGILGRPPQQKAYELYGNSYQLNTLLVWVPVPSGPYAALYKEISNRLTGLTRDKVSEPSRLLFFGDTNWVTQWSPFFPQGIDWHGKDQHYNIAFLDGHTAFLKIEKGPFAASKYRILPFSDLDELVPSLEK
ncbi:MAG: type II secretion system protein [Sedimentisphaerales bacterium]|nr:type II secretion system protein [Sedimentisphaerales bacterium]